MAARAGASPADPADALAFDPVPLRPRCDGLTLEKQRAYVEALADCGVAREAAARIGISERSVARVRRRSDARSFDRACHAAQRFGARALRSIAWQRAIEGTLKGHYYHGERISEERVYDNRLLIYLLGKTEHLADPAEEAESRAVCANWEPCMDALERGLPPPDLAPAEEERNAAEDAFNSGEVWQDEPGTWRTVFPPPDGFEGEEEGVWNGVDWYCRTLTPGEQAAVDALLDHCGTAAEDRARECARRDRFFGFAGDGISSPREAGLSGPSAALPSPGDRGGERAGPVEQGPESDHNGPDTSSEGGSGP